MIPGLGKLGTVRMDAAILSNRGSLNAAMSAADARCTAGNGRRAWGNGWAAPAQAGDDLDLMELCDELHCIGRRTLVSIGTCELTFVERGWF